MWGYFKKMVIADRAAVLVDTVMPDNCPYGGAVIAVGIFFTASSSTATSPAASTSPAAWRRCWASTMAENFRRPLFATSLADYWRRWHITLGQWMRDYLFYPLSLSKPFGRLGKWARRHIGGLRGKDLRHVPGHVCGLSGHRRLARVQLPVHRLRPLERHDHHRLAAAGAAVPKLEGRSAHRRQFPGPGGSS